MDLKKFKEKSKKMKMSEMGVYLLSYLQSLIEEVDGKIESLHSNKKHGQLTTVGGSSSEEFSIKGVKPCMKCIVQLESKGASPVIIETVSCELDKIVLEFSGDPSNDHIINYYIFN